MGLWKSPPPVEEINRMSAGTAAAQLGIEVLEFTEDCLRGRMPVDQRTIQPAGVLHGGISVAFAETLASLAATFAVDRQEFHCVGQEINANHVRAARSGWVYGEARPLHLGKSSQVWEVRICDESKKLVCISRMTAAVLPKPSEYRQQNSDPSEA